MEIAAGIPIVCVPGCPVQPDNFMETLLYLLHMAAGRAPMIPLDDALRPTWLFGQTVHEGCDRGGYYEQAEFAEEYGSRTCIVKLGCWGPVVQCNVGKRGWMAGIGGCPNVGGICIGCTMPGFPDKFMPFMNQPPGSLLSSSAVMTYGRAIHALRRFTQASLNKEPSWRRTPEVSLTIALATRMSAPPFDPSAYRRSRSGVWPISPVSSFRPLRPRPQTLARPNVRKIRGPAWRHDTESAGTDSGRRVHGLSGSRASAKPMSVPQIEATLGFSQEEWLEDPVRWYQQIHPDDKDRWSTRSGGNVSFRKPLRSSYRVLARDGRVVWFHCEARMVRRETASPGSFTALGSTSPN